MKVEEASMPKYSDSLRGYGYDVMLRDNFCCLYCGYDGREFSHWLQLTIDHVLPAHQGGQSDESDQDLAESLGIRVSTFRVHRHNFREKILAYI